MKKIAITIILIFSNTLAAQVTNTAIMDSLSGTTINKITIGGYIDSYYGGTFSKTIDENLPYFVSMARNNEVNINLAYIDVRYHDKSIRARFVPGFGSYMNANYANETGTFKNIVEASVGVKLSKTKEIWLDAGVLGSPYTNESAISKDHLMYTRSFAPEYVPYYLSGVKLSFPLSKKLMGYIYFINGWQQIKDNNSGKSFGTQIEFKPNNYHLINWNTYLGDERSEFLPNFRTRYFTDIYWIYNKDKFSATSCFYIGNQKKMETIQENKNNIWWQANIIGRYSFTEKISLSGRIEFFNDANNIQITGINATEGFKTFSSGFCLNYHLNKNAMFRIEGRQFFSNDNLYIDSNNNPTKSMTWLISNLTIWF
jgi:hypothetical protein